MYECVLAVIVSLIESKFSGTKKDVLMHQGPLVAL